MKNACVVGHPVGHSLSPSIFNYLARILGRENFQYEAVDCSEEKLLEFVTLAKEKYVGFNITHPLKEKIILHLKRRSPEIEILKACNVIKVENKAFSGFNTDVVGIAETLRQNVVSVKNKNILIIGAGGAARSAVYALASEGASTITLLNRTSHRADRVVDAMRTNFPQCRLLAAKNVASDHYDIVINATPLGMSGFKSEVEASLFFREILKAIASRNSLEKFKAEQTVAFDLVYRPKKTPFLVEAEKLGFKLVGGLEMLIFQALATWEIWWGINESRPLLADSLNKYLSGFLGSSEPSIFLCGFMGVGKSTVGACLAPLLNFEHVDTDRDVETLAGLSIAQIFNRGGEEEFRKLESNAVSDVCRKENTVISLGGGALNNSENFRRVAECGILIYLRASVTTIMARLKSSKQKRPLINQLSDQVSNDICIEQVNSLMKLREGSYRLAHVVIDTDNLSEAAVAQEIYKVLESRKCL